MKSAVAAVGLLASLASAASHQPRHFHWRRDNSTVPVSAPAGYTTLTVEITEIATVTSCAPTVTDCPARSANASATDLSTYIVTNVVVLTETICPVTEADKISKSLVDQHSTGGLTGSTRTAPVGAPTPSAPAPGGAVPTGVASQTASAQEPTVTSPPSGDDEDDDYDCPADEGEVETTVTKIVSTKTLTMTVGKGSTASVITTAVETTAESTILITKPYSEGAEKPTASIPAAGSVTGVTGAEEPTTTVTQTSTGTRTVTVKRPGASEPASPGSGSGSGSGSGEECVASTVTVTAPASTVYVTIGGGASSVPTAPVNGNGDGGDYGSEPSKTASAQIPTTTGTDAEDEDDDADCPADESDDSSSDDSDDECPADEETVTLSTTVTVAPYPTNGTLSSGSAKPTGAYRRSNKLF
ncbi:hypothetical protein Cob_v009666 [Colletotrichum orbiculare MAFF 240422]|uniref:Uncharacterized protein n=1 Tax=Colletotrichum orbiculare (strain 104-T / ATCC 96160 / CBS 514.97 / LARS 414 / MAFF 240422) TaxID=1213857 RepID=N4VGI6_COLOR|nr:hypothetical protein Cob_v009666 [Colletotrichum orbiculare MAFF 240422]